VVLAGTEDLHSEIAELKAKIQALESELEKRPSCNIDEVPNLLTFSNPEETVAEIPESYFAGQNESATAPNKEPQEAFIEAFGE
jgi:hypothetical protein